MTSMPVNLHRDLASNNLPPIPEPWTWRDTLRFTVVGAVLGFVGGFFHLIMMITRHDSGDRSQKPDRGKP